MTFGRFKERKIRSKLARKEIHVVKLGISSRIPMVSQLTAVGRRERFYSRGFVKIRELIGAVGSCDVY